MTSPNDEPTTSEKARGATGEDRVTPAKALSAPPRASVVLCVYNRAESVVTTLESLAASDFADFEIVAVDDASTDGSSEVLEEFRRSHPALSMTIVENSRNLGVSGARNSGIGAVRGQIVLFTDSDCVVGRDWVGLHVGAYDRPEVAAACGPVEDAPPTNYAGKAYSGTTLVGRGKIQSRSLVGNNMSFRLEVLLDFGFDPALEYYCDDDDIAWRLEATGHRIAFIPEALVRHNHFLDLSGYLKMAFKQGQGSARFWYKKGQFLGRDVAALAAAILTLPLGLLGSRWLVVPAALTVVQCLAYLYSEIAFKGKSLVRAIIVLPLLLTHGLVKLAGISATYVRLFLKRESAIRDSKRQWKERRRRFEG